MTNPRETVDGLCLWFYQVQNSMRKLTDSVRSRVSEKFTALTSWTSANAEGDEEIRSVRRSFRSVVFMSIALNLLMLVPSLYMLQIYDRVIASRSEETLVALTILVAALFCVAGVLKYWRGRLASRVGLAFQDARDARVFNYSLSRAIDLRERSRPATGLQDLAAVQRFLSSPVLFAICDLPWLFIFVGVIYTFHSWLGHLAVFGALVLVGVTWLNQVYTRRPEAEANALSIQSDSFAETARQNCELIQALGMRKSVLKSWQNFRHNSLVAQRKLGDRVAGFSTITETFRFFLQSATLGLGALLVLKGQLTPGAMIAGSILLGRALAPVEQAISGWPLFLRARQGWSRLQQWQAMIPVEVKSTALPRPRGKLEVQMLVVVPPGQQKATLRLDGIELEPGQALGVIGLSGCGKSTLARALVGVWPPANGTVRLDGAELRHYDPDVLGRYIGYLPQDATLFDGTIAENIARLSQPDDAKVVEAAKRAGAHDMILGLPDGYDTKIFAGGARLSGGQRQRIALARALYDNPVLLVLDEPNSSLDLDGQSALNEAIADAKRRGCAVVITTHRPVGVEMCDHLLIMVEGMKQAYGPRDQVLKAHVRNHTKVTSTTAA